MIRNAQIPGFNIPVSELVCNPLRPNDAKYRGSSHIVETARQHRYILELLEPLGQPATNQADPTPTDADSTLVFAYSATRPKVTFDKITIHNAQDEIFRPGKHHWSDVDLTFYEVLSKNGEKPYGKITDLIYRWWAETMLNINTSYFAPPEQYLKNCKLSMVDGIGNAVWSYNLYDCWPCEVSPSDVSYVNSDIANITMKLRYDKAVEDYVGRPTTQSGIT